MKKALLVFSVLFLSLALLSQQIKEEATVINIEVPVRVFSGKNFIENLTIDDFEVFENGVSQNIEAVYFVKKRSVERSQEKKRFSPKTARSFFLFFELSRYDPKIGDAIRYFVHNVLAPGDDLSFVTSMKTYRMKNIAFEVTSPEEVTNQLIKIVRRDTMTGNSEYRLMINDISELAQSLSAHMAQGRMETSDQGTAIDELMMPITEGGSSGFYSGRSLEEEFSLYENYVFKLENLRRMDQKKLLDFAKLLKKKEGQKYVTIFYQKEFIPQLNPQLLSQTMSLYQDSPTIIQTISNVIEFYRREVQIDTELVKQTYADSSISIHFLYLTTPPESQYGVYMADHSEDIFSAFQEMAIATGGYINSSSRADYLIKSAIEASENYYLLYYSPSHYIVDGKFKEIVVKVKNKDYRISHRVGYFAN
jgi:VWFA-related protein